MNQKTIAIVGGGGLLLWLLPHCASRDLTANYTCFPMSSISPMNVHRSPKRCCWTTIRNFSRYSPLTGGGNTTYSCIWVLLYRRSAAKRISWCWLMGRVIRGIGY